jgi:hypothetical protein
MAGFVVDAKILPDLADRSRLDLSNLGVEGRVSTKGGQQRLRPRPSAVDDAGHEAPLVCVGL